jgi:sulfite oxidase
MSLWGKRDDMVVHATEPFNAEPPRGALADQMVTPVDTFYGRNHGPIPQIDVAGWRLTVDGLVDQALELSVEDLRARFAERSLVATLQCAGNRRAELMEVRDIPGETPWGSGAISTARWTGASLADVLAAAGVRPEAAHVGFTGSDVSQLADPPQPFAGSIPLAKATTGDVLLAWAMNDQPIPQVHGAPVRVVVPGFVGARSVKWLRRITAQAEPSDSYFQAIDYRVLPADAHQAQADAGISLGPAAVTADILHPDPGAQLPAGPAKVTGYAFGGDCHSIARVEVSVDGGRTWLLADLDEQAEPWTWRHWRAVVALPEGETQIVARAWDSTATVQPESAEHLWNPKGYANNSWARVRVTCRT